MIIKEQTEHGEETLAKQFAKGYLNNRLYAQWNIKTTPGYGSDGHRTQQRGAMKI